MFWVFLGCMQIVYNWVGAAFMLRGGGWEFVLAALGILGWFWGFHGIEEFSS